MRLTGLYPGSSHLQFLLRTVKIRVCLYFPHHQYMRSHVSLTGTSDLISKENFYYGCCLSLRFLAAPQLEAATSREKGYSFPLKTLSAHSHGSRKYLKAETDAEAIEEGC